MTNEELRDKVPAAVMDQVVACDPRYQHHLPDGSFVLETEDGLVTLTLEQYARASVMAFFDQLPVFT